MDSTSSTANRGFDNLRLILGSSRRTDEDVQLRRATDFQNEGEFELICLKFLLTTP